jgi:hypothetical protein
LNLFFLKIFFVNLNAGSLRIKDADCLIAEAWDALTTKPFRAKLIVGSKRSLHETPPPNLS